jgi:hypothetical protein
MLAELLETYKAVQKVAMLVYQTVELSVLDMVDETAETTEFEMAALSEVEMVV